MNHGDHGADVADAADASGASSAAIDPGARAPIPVREAVAVLMPTKGNSVSGVVRFRTDGPGTDVDVIASIDGLPAGVHAYHVHVYGDCSSPDAQSAGPHFHFVGSSFEEQRFITGNLGELQANGKSTVTQRGTIHAMLQGKYSLLGRAVVIHEKGNNHASPPDGAAGKRLACGVIGVANQGPAPSATASAADPYHP